MDGWNGNSTCSEFSKNHDAFTSISPTFARLYGLVRRLIHWSRVWKMHKAADPWDAIRMTVGPMAGEHSLMITKLPMEI